MNGWAGLAENGVEGGIGRLAAKEHIFKLQLDGLL
jgi:hypothetical protein